jgi:hypothetical protein
MKELFAIAILLTATETVAAADDAHLSLAEQIEQLSETQLVLGGNHDVFPERKFRSYIEVNGCELTTKKEELGPEGLRVRSLTFDLARTQVPDPEDQNSEKWGIVHVGKDGGFGEIFFEFIPPYAPVPRGFHYESAPHGPVKSDYFVLKGIDDLDRLSHLLVLLNRYKTENCSLSV